MSVPPIFPFLGGTLPPLIKERLRPELVSDPPPAMDVAGGRPLNPVADAPPDGGSRV